MLLSKVTYNIQVSAQKETEIRIRTLMRRGTGTEVQKSSKTAGRFSLRGVFKGLLKVERGHQL